MIRSIVLTAAALFVLGAANAAPPQHHGNGGNTHPSGGGTHRSSGGGGTHHNSGSHYTPSHRQSAYRGSTHRSASHRTVHMAVHVGGRTHFTRHLAGHRTSVRIAIGGYHAPRAHDFYYRDRWMPRLRGARFAYPRGYGYRRWSRGQFLPGLFLTAPFLFTAYETLGIDRPPPGYAWVRYGPDLVLVNLRNGEVDQVLYGVYY